MEKWLSKKKKKYNLDIEIISKLVEPLTKLSNMVGLQHIKDKIFSIILFYLQGLENKNNDLLNTVLEGPPGVGKTEVSKILADIYLNLGILKKGNFQSVKRSQLIGGYLGQTAIKTQDVLDNCTPGVLFIDEAYSLGNQEKKDSFSKECIDTINAHLVEHKNDFICIIAGYKEDLNNCFFKYNSGLERRFPYRFTMKPYKPEELCLILQKKIINYG